MKIAIIPILLLLVGCFAGENGAGSERGALRSEVEFVADEGLEGSVVVDSLAWIPFLPHLGFGSTTEFEGGFSGVFRNVDTTEVWVRYDLRFFDREEFLIDAFIPFGQPVVLAGGNRKGCGRVSDSNGGSQGFRAALTDALSRADSVAGAVIFLSSRGCDTPTRLLIWVAQKVTNPRRRGCTGR